jgi:hypothetical protein
MRNSNIFLLFFVLLTIAFAPIVSLGQTPKTEFMPLESVRPVLEKMPDSVPPALKKEKLDDKTWTTWVKTQDAEIRHRLETGEEDTLTNLLRFGVMFTKEYQIDREYLGRYGHSSLVDGFADRRADDLIRALQSPSANEGMQEMRALLEKKGFSFKSPQERARVKKYLLANLARMRDEFTSYREKLKSTDLSGESHLYAERGISLDTNLWPDYALDKHLREMVKAGLLKPGSVHRVAIVGPGLDFANKENGNDFYPPQTIQPFAVIDSLARLGLVDPKSVELYTLDISPSINVHLSRARERAARGQSYTVQLPWNGAVPWSAEYLAEFTKYWQALGDQIGTSVAPAPIPAAAASEQLHLRAVTIRPEIVKRIRPVDTNIVFQRLAFSRPEEQFDLVIGTNIFIYYGPFEQSLARANVASILKPGGFLLSNNLLTDKVTSKLTEVQRTTITVSMNPAITEYIFCYRREP